MRFWWVDKVSNLAFNVLMKTTLIFLMALWSVTSSKAFGSSDDYQYFNNSGVKIAYRVFGSGAPLVVLNGGPGRSSDTFTELAETLQAKTHRQVIIFDQRGTGRSKLPVLDESTVSLDLMVGDLEALRKHLGFSKISILGHSFGGMYAMTYASRYPDNVESLILSCSGGIDLSWKDYAQHNMLSRLNQKARLKYKFWTSPEQEAKDPIRAGMESFRLLIPSYIYHQKFIPRLERDLLNPKFETEGLNELVWKTMENYDLKDALKVFLAPTLIIDGRQDILGEAVPIKIHDTISNSKLEFLDECSHYPWLDSPEKYFSLIKDFLT
jgi:proline iminopeptidase